MQTLILDFIKIIIILISLLLTVDASLSHYFIFKIKKHQHREYIKNLIFAIFFFSVSLVTISLFVNLLTQYF